MLLPDQCIHSQQKLGSLLKAGKSWGQVFDCANIFSHHHKRQLLCKMKDLTLIFLIFLFVIYGISPVSPQTSPDNKPESLGSPSHSPDSPHSSSPTDSSPTPDSPHSSHGSPDNPGSNDSPGSPVSKPGGPGISESPGSPGSKPDGPGSKPDGLERINPETQSPGSFTYLESSTYPDSSSIFFWYQKRQTGHH